LIVNPASIIPPREASVVSVYSDLIVFNREFIEYICTHNFFISFDIHFMLAQILNVRFNNECINAPCLEKMDVQSSMNNFNKFKLSFTIFGTHYPDDFLLKTCKICFQNLLIIM